MGSPRRYEIEIRLVGDQAALSALKRSRVFRALAVGEERRERLAALYYDTQDGALAAAGASLRLREEGGRLFQTVKGKTRGEGALIRLEETQPVAAQEDFPQPPRDPALASLLGAAKGALRPVAASVCDRAKYVLKSKRTGLEASFDIGRLEGWRDGALFATAPLSELEIERISGPLRGLFRAARLFLEEGEGALRLADVTKFDRARALAAPGVPLAAAAFPRLDPQASAADALRVALKGVAARLLECVPAVRDLRLAEGAHQMRVALRRLRAIERIYRKAANDDALRALSARARYFARALSPARDWDVFIDETLPAARNMTSTDDIAMLAERAGRLRAEAWDKASAMAASLDFNLFLLDLLEAAHCPRRGKARKALERPAVEFARKALDARLASALALGAEISGAREDALHRLRIELKKLRYAAQAFRSLYAREGRRPYLAALAALQEELGALNDAAVAQRLAVEAARGGKEKAKAAAARFAEARRQAAARAADSIGEDFAAFATMEPFWRARPPDFQSRPAS